MCINSSDSFLFSTSLFVRSANHKRDWFIVNYGGQQLLLGGINTLGCAGISNINLICYFFKDRGGDFSVKHQKNKKQSISTLQHVRRQHSRTHTHAWTLAVDSKVQMQWMCVLDLRGALRKRKCVHDSRCGRARLCKHIRGC